MSLRTLSEILPGIYPESDPQTGTELFQAEDYDALSDVAKELRRHIVDALHGAERNPITSPMVAKGMLERGHLNGLYRRWTTFALDSHRARLLRPTASGGRAWSKIVTKKVPHPDRLARDIPVAEGGRYLVLYRGSVSILGVEDRHGGSVALDLSYLRANAPAPVCDVLFWDAPPGEVPTLYSLLAGAGDRAGEPVEFPDAAALATALAEPTRSATAEVPEGGR